MASVFAYTVLSAGIFSSEKGKEAVYSGLEQARSTLEFKGDMVAKDTDYSITMDQVIFTVTNALNGEAIDLTPTAGGNNVTVISYTDSTQRLDNLSLDSHQASKMTEIICWNRVRNLSLLWMFQMLTLGTYTTFSLEVKPPKGSVLTIESTTPAEIYPITILN